MLKIYLQFFENTKLYDILRYSEVEEYFRYVDDIILVYKNNLTNIEEIINLFNNITPRLVLRWNKNGMAGYISLISR